MGGMSIVIQSSQRKGDTMDIVFKTKYKTFVKVQYGKWNPNEKKYVTVYKSEKANPIK